MSNVKLDIGGRQFTVACADGEEDHVAALGAMIAGKIDTMGDLAGQSESRMLLFAALLLADELHDSGGAAAPAAAAGLSEADARRLADIADRLENLAGRLEA